MLTEYHGQAVAGGTFPALIWKSFMESALPYLAEAPEPFAYPGYLSSESRRLVLRDGTFQLDNGLCRNTISIQYFTGRAPGKTANCKPNEVEVPNVVGSSYDAARFRLGLQPLTPVVVYKPASPRQPLGVVVKQIPPRGRLFVPRQGDDRVREAVARGRPECGGAAAGEGAAEAGAPEAEAGRPGKGDEGRAPAAAWRAGGGARPPGHALVRRG